MKIKLLAILLMISSLAGSVFLVPAIAASAGRHTLTSAQRAEDSDPPEVSLGIAMGAFRGLFVNMLWMRANELKEQGMFHESIELAKTITKLQPRFPRVWAFHAWNLAYNISVETQTPQERYQWVMSGVRLLRDEGIPANPNDLYLHKELAWILLHKIGGFTDDANRFYKRELAAEWTVVMGPPPRASGENRGRDEIIALYVEWLRPIAESPATIDGVIKQAPAAERLLAQLRTRVGVEPGRELLERWTQHNAIKDSPRRPIFEAAYGPKNAAFAELFADPQYAEAWAVLVPHTRQRLLADEYHMSVRRMMRYTEKFGPLDWRHHGSHALYWASQGIERSLSRFDETNRQNFDFVNTDRMVMQAIQSLYRSGDLYFNYLSYLNGGRGYFQGMPNEYFVESYGDIYEDVVERAGVYEDPSRPRRNYATGYENFLEDAISFFYRRGQFDKADEWFTRLRTWDGQNVHTDQTRPDRYSSLEDLVNSNLFDRYTSPHVAAGQVAASLQGAFQALIRGDTDLFLGQFEFARQVHAYFFNEQYREVVASDGAGARMEWMDKDFRYVAGGVFAATIDNLDYDEAEIAYSYAPASLQQYAYDILYEKFKPSIDAAQTSAGGPDFEVLFPEPDGMAQFREYLERKEQERGKSNLDSINQQ